MPCTQHPQYHNYATVKSILFRWLRGQRRRWLARHHRPDSMLVADHLVWWNSSVAALFSRYVVLLYRVLLLLNPACRMYRNSRAVFRETRSSSTDREWSRRTRRSDTRTCSLCPCWILCIRPCKQYRVTYSYCKPICCNLLHSVDNLPDYIITAIIIISRPRSIIN